MRRVVRKARGSIIAVDDELAAREQPLRRDRAAVRPRLRGRRRGLSPSAALAAVEEAHRAANTSPSCSPASGWRSSTAPTSCGSVRGSSPRTKRGLLIAPEDWGRPSTRSPSRRRDRHRVHRPLPVQAADVTRRGLPPHPHCVPPGVDERPNSGVHQSSVLPDRSTDDVRRLRRHHRRRRSGRARRRGLRLVRGARHAGDRAARRSAARPGRAR